MAKYYRRHKTELSVVSDKIKIKKAMINYKHITIDEI